MTNENKQHFDLTVVSDFASKMMVDQTKDMLGNVVKYKELMMMYSCAIKEIKTKFEILSTEFNMRYKRNPIEFTSTRLKSNSSIIKKLNRKNIDFSIENLEKRLDDIAGVRVVCSYIDDIYIIAKALVNQDDITLLKTKDYIKNPKENGYRSLHLIVKVPVFFANYKKDLKVEVQIRTIAMDFWASLEHKLKYKKDLENTDEIFKDLKECADCITATDEKMLSIRNKIEKNNKVETEEDIFYELMRKIEIPII